MEKFVELAMHKTYYPPPPVYIILSLKSYMTQSDFIACCMQMIAIIALFSMIFSVNPIIEQQC
jgi:hypothetical protein